MSCSRRARWQGGHRRWCSLTAYIYAPTSPGGRMSLMNVRTRRASEWEAERERKGRRLGLREGHREWSIFHDFFTLNNVSTRCKDRGESLNMKTRADFRLPELHFLYFYVRHQEIFKGYSVTCEFQSGLRWSSIQTDKSTRLLRYVDNREDQRVLHFHWKPNHY